MTYTASAETVDHLAALVQQARPAWELTTIRLVLLAHAGTVDGTDLAIAALRAAIDPNLPSPKAIGWRGPHWRDLKTCPPSAAKSPLCWVCNKPEHRCYSERKGVDDDHAFEARP